MKSLTTAIIGCGNISKFHFQGMKKAGATIKWVCDIREETARPWKEKYGATFTDNYQEILSDPEVDVLNVTTPSRLHKAICLDAIKKGKAVVCEKTLAESSSDAHEIVRASEEAGTIFYTSYMKRFLPAVQKAAELLPELGRLLSTHIRSHQCWGDLWSTHPESGFFHTPPNGRSKVAQNYGGGILVCAGSHILDLVTFFLGRPEKLYANVHTPQDGRDYDLSASAFMETPNGVVHYEAMAHPLRHVGFLRDGWDERIEINGVNGRLDILIGAWDTPEHKPSMLVHYDNQSGHATEYRFDGISPFDKAMDFFCAQIRAGRQGAQSRWTGYEVDELIEHFLISSREGKAVAVNWKS
jgi:predicted dehydrogenase